MNIPRFILYCKEYNHNGESMNPDSWDDCQYTFSSEEGLRNFINSQLEFLFKVVAIYRLDENFK